MTAAPDAAPIVECRHVSKRFGATVALDEASVRFQAGTVHALVGENGAGKSTLAKVIAGVHQPDAGSVNVDGQSVELRSPRVALDLGIAMIAQELSLLPARSVLDNVFLGMEPKRRGVLDLVTARERFDEVSMQYGIKLDPATRVGSMPIAEQQRVEILRGLARDARILILDEPTARLSHREAASLADSLRLLVERGVTIIYVSHFLKEVLDLSDRVTVLRNGQVIRTGETADEDRESLVEGIAGRRLDAAYPARRPVDDDAPVVLSVDGIGRLDEFHDVSFEVRAGEIVTLAGLVGSGRSEVAHAVFGATQTTAGTMALEGAPHRPVSPHSSIRSGIALIPESRRDQGLMLRRSVSENVSLPHLKQFSAGGILRRRFEKERVLASVDGVGVTGATIETPMFGLSGGNQQKSLFARALIESPLLLLADEPTRGVDVASKRAIYDLMVELAEQGMAILVISSEIDEVLGISHRIIVMRGGRVVGELDGATAGDDELMRLAFGIDDPGEVAADVTGNDTSDGSRGGTT